MAKSLCKWRRGDVDAELELLATIVSPPCVACSKCARVARDKSYLCRPTPLPASSESVTKKVKKKAKDEKLTKKALKKGKKGKKTAKSKKEKKKAKASKNA
ncbi:MULTISPECIES: hypothetical protein [Salinivibrio]|uniref:hypothetical protein n=1 Tax=Salinivibrio TaxID=51366 RepID=UPI000985BBFB|nr:MULTISPECIES: hypothetical protein [Salinivibrio]OOF11890.1 hypothetical protein BZG82_02975 [Salinivibrio sp. PR5]OOF14842.1 hypothetical protein BZG83_04790 [Salinivibrio sp. PR919]OOF18811.1 hypothetical protein BZG84_02920 [Salinivibrio sp. PR932]OOF29699.1 hypothetical protein BZJ20_14415 [Salinivibrio proteolyticus]